MDEMIDVDLSGFLKVLYGQISTLEIKYQSEKSGMSPYLDPMAQILRHPTSSTLTLFPMILVT